MVDRVPAYVVKNKCTGKKKVLHHSRLLVWLPNFGKPVWMNRMCTSVTLLKQNPENPLPRSEDGDPVLGCMQYGLNLAKLWIIDDTPELVMCWMAQEVQMGTLHNGTGLQIELRVDEEADPECLGSFTEDVPCS